MMALNRGKLLAALQRLLAAQADTVFAYVLQLRKQELDEGWRCFHARELWFEDNLPPPLLNTLGRQYMVEKLRCDIYRGGDTVDRIHVATVPSAYVSEFLTQFFAREDQREGYRNFLDVGRLEVDSQWADDKAFALDAVANEVTRRLLEEAHRHYRFEIDTNAADWLFEINDRATISPPYNIWDLVLPAPVRNPDLALAYDMNYWSRFYMKERWFGQELGALFSPSWTMKLMAAHAPDFPYAAGLSSRQRLVFMQEGESDMAWAIIVGKIGGAAHYVFPPRLVLIERRPGHKIRDSDVLFHSIVPMGQGGKPDESARGIELQLLYFLARFRRLIDFYAPYLAQALVEIA